MFGFVVKRNFLIAGLNKPIHVQITISIYVWVISRFHWFVFRFYLLICHALIRSIGIVCNWGLITRCQHVQEKLLKAEFVFSNRQGLLFHDYKVFVSESIDKKPLSMPSFMG